MSDEGPDPVEELQQSKQLDIGAFDARVRQEAAVVREQLDAGTFDNDQTTIGLEYEFYAVDRETTRLRRIPRALLRCLGFEKELGLHNAELNAGVQPLNERGAEALLHAVGAKLASIQEQAADEGLRFVSDGMWTIGPEHSTTKEYLTAATHKDGLTFAINVSNAVRYHGFGSVNRNEIGGRIDLPGAHIEAETASPVSLTTSIQPHYQLRRSSDLPEYHRYALRIAGPLLALAVNSPFLPPDLYDDPSDDVLLHESYAENRIPIYEGIMNPAEADPKVRFPTDIDSPGDAVDRIVEDVVYIPADITAGERFDAQFVHFRHKHGSFWRWVRPVFEGATEEEANVRIEFRPLPAQPTVPDTVAFTVVVCGALTGLAASEHPVRDLPWETARDNFYAAAWDGIDAELSWITATGERTTDRAVIFEDLLSAASDGLDRHGFSEAATERWLEEIRTRADQRMSPADWKRARVAERLDAGDSPTDAIHAMQRNYVEHQRETLFDGHFTDWIAD